MESIIPINLRYSDTDQMGVIYHAHYLTYFEQGRTAFLKDLGYDYSNVEKAGYLFPVRDVQCTYLKAMKYGDRITLKTKVLKLSKIQITYGHELYNQNNELCAKGQTSVVSVKSSDFTLTKFDKIYPDLYLKYKENID